MRKVMLCVMAILVMSATVPCAKAQMGSAKSNVAPGTMVAPAKALEDLLSTYEKELTGVAEEMPADKYGFAPATANFAPGSPEKFAGVRTFAQQISHLVSANYYFYSSASGMKPEGADMKAIGAMTKKEDLLKALAASFAFAHKAVASITEKNAFEAIKSVDGQNTRATLAAFAVAHGYDHYGQLVEYLRMNGLVPPGSK